MPDSEGFLAAGPIESDLERHEPAQPARSARCRNSIPWLVIGPLLALCLWGIAPRGGVMAMGLPTISLAKVEKPKCADFPKLHILDVAHNNLAYMGPGFGREGIKYHVRAADGKEMFMDVNSLAPFKAGDPENFGMIGPYGTINVAGNSVAPLVVSFRDYRTNEKALVDDFALTFFDIDQGSGGAGREALTISGNWSMAVLARDTTVLVHRSEDERKITFEATRKSERNDDPRDPNKLTLNQFNKAITLRFQHAHEFRMNLEVETLSHVSCIFEFIGMASILCAESRNGEELPIGEVYVNKAQMKEVETTHPNGRNGMWWLLGALLLGCCLAAIPIFFCWLKKEEVTYRTLEVAPEEPPQSPKQGPGIFTATFAAGPGTQTGLHLDAPMGQQLYPMIKKILEVGAVATFNKQQKSNAIEVYDMIVAVGDLCDSALIVPELMRDLPVQATLTLDRPHKIHTTLHSDLGVKLDAAEDSQGAVILEIRPEGSIAKFNIENPHLRMNKYDRILRVNGTSRFLEEMEDFKDQNLEVTMLKYTTFETMGLKSPPL